MPAEVSRFLRLKQSVLVEPEQTAFDVEMQRSPHMCLHVRLKHATTLEHIISKCKTFI